MWSFVQNKKNQRWLWLAIDHKTHVALAYTFGHRKDKVFNELKCLLEPFGICTFYTDNLGSYECNLDSEKHIVGKRNTQAIERKNLTFRTRIKRLCRKTICFSKSIVTHDIIIGLVINILEFGWIIKTYITIKYKCSSFKIPVYMKKEDNCLKSLLNPYYIYKFV